MCVFLSSIKEVLNHSENNIIVQLRKLYTSFQSGDVVDGKK